MRRSRPIEAVRNGEAALASISSNIASTARRIALTSRIVAAVSTRASAMAMRAARAAAAAGGGGAGAAAAAGGGGAGAAAAAGGGGAGAAAAAGGGRTGAAAAGGGGAGAASSNCVAPAAPAALSVASITRHMMSVAGARNAATSEVRDTRTWHAHARQNNAHEKIAATNDAIVEQRLEMRLRRPRRKTTRHVAILFIVADVAKSARATSARNDAARRPAAPRRGARRGRIESDNCVH
jgi:hypothetical protein